MMEGIDLNLPIEYFSSTYRRLTKSDKLSRREAANDIIMLVFSGKLGFCLGGTFIELSSGEYYVQRAGTVIESISPSNGTELFFISFRASWREGEHVLPKSGVFNTEELLPIFEELDTLYRSSVSLTERCACFYTLLTRILPRRSEDTLVDRVKRHIDREYVGFRSLDELSELFHYSKNHIINVFRNSYGMTPVEYANELRLGRAAYLLETTLLGTDAIAAAVGFNHYSHFYRLFTRRYGKSPNKWRVDTRWLTV